MKSENLMVLGALALGAYIVYKTVGAVDRGVDNTLQFLNSVGSSLGSKLFDLFNPESDYMGDNYFYMVTFPNGKRHSIGASKVNKVGQFNYIEPPLAATRWQLVKRKDNKGWYAAAVA